MLNNEPRRFRSILADCLFVRSATFVDDHFEPLCIPDVHRFHAWNIASAELTGFNQFSSNSHIFGAHGGQFLTLRLPWSHIDGSQIERVDRASKSKRVHFIRITHRDEVEAPDHGLAPGSLRPVKHPVKNRTVETEIQDERERGRPKARK